MLHFVVNVQTILQTTIKFINSQEHNYKRDFGMATGNSAEIANNFCVS